MRVTFWIKGKVAWKYSLCNEKITVLNLTGENNVERNEATEFCLTHPSCYESFKNLTQYVWIVYYNILPTQLLFMFTAKDKCLLNAIKSVVYKGKNMAETDICAISIDYECSRSYELCT